MEKTAIPAPVSDCEVRDPRVRRTRQMLQNSLKKLLKIKSFEEIVVQDITTEATLNRGTFYDHYRDKYALFDAMVAHDFHMLLEHRNISFDGTCPSALNAIVMAVCDYLEQTHLGSNRNCTEKALVPLMDAAITASLRRVFFAGLSKELVAGLVSWAIFGAVKEWFQLPERGPKEVVVPEIVRLLLPIFENA